MTPEEIESPERPEEKIRRDLVRTVIKQPLYDKCAKADRPEERIPVIIEINEDYFGGRGDAEEALRELLLGFDRGLSPVGSPQIPYFKTALRPAEVLKVAEQDYDDARRRWLLYLSGRNAGEGKSQPLWHFLSIRRMWYDHPINGLIDKSVSTVKADAAQRAFLADGKDIVWAVIDSGIDATHEHFTSSATCDVELPLEHCDFTIPGGGTPVTALTDELGHGTHVAGTIAGRFAGPRAVAQRTRLDDSGAIDTFEETISTIAGMAPTCKLVSMKVLNGDGEGGISNILAALDTIQSMNDQGRNLRIQGVNLSVGYEFDPSWFACGQSPVCVEVNRLVRSGVVVVIAAGNTGYGTLAAQQRVTGAGMMMTINDPGNADLAITVGSTHRDAPHTYGVSYFSSKGPTGDGRKKPDLVAPGERILSCCSSSKAAGKTNVYFEDSGTSMAAPHVSGAIAAFLSIRREYIGNPEKIKELFLGSATDLGRESYFQGHGLLDLMRAIQSV